MTRYRHKNYSNRLPISRQRRGRNRGATHLSAASARDLRAYCHTPSDRSEVFGDGAMMIEGVSKFCILEKNHTLCRLKGEKPSFSEALSPG